MMMKKKKKKSKDRWGWRYVKGFMNIFLFMIFLMSFAYAVAPITQISLETTDAVITIVYPKIIIYKQDESFIMPFDVLDSNYSRLDNTTTTCIYNVINSQGKMIQGGNLFYNVSLGHWQFTMSGLKSTFYHFNYYVHCSDTSTGLSGFISSTFYVTETGKEDQTDLSVVSVLILIPIIFGVLLMFGAFALNSEKHPVLRIFLILLSFITYLISSWFGVQALAKYYGFEDLQNNAATSVLALGLMIGMIIIYFLIYAFYKATNAAAQNKKEMMLE